MNKSKSMKLNMVEKRVKKLGLRPNLHINSILVHIVAITYQFVFFSFDFAFNIKLRGRCLLQWRSKCRPRCSCPRGIHHFFAAIRFLHASFLHVGLLQRVGSEQFLKDRNKVNLMLFWFLFNFGLTNLTKRLLTQH